MKNDYNTTGTAPLPTLIFFGDSNTYGYDPRLGGEGQYDESIRWTEILKRDLLCEIETHGICGRYIPHYQSQIDFAREQVRGWDQIAGPVWLFIMLGTNDLQKEEGFTAEDAAARMQHFLQQLQEEPAVASGHISLYLITPPKMYLGPWVSDEAICKQSLRIGETYRKVAADLGIDFIDTSDWDIPISFDGIHLSEEGHRSFAHDLQEWIMEKL